jgi:hypothetical protein
MIPRGRVFVSVALVTAVVVVLLVLILKGAGPGGGPELGPPEPVAGEAEPSGGGAASSGEEGIPGLDNTAPAARKPKPPGGGRVGTATPAEETLPDSAGAVVATLEDQTGVVLPGALVTVQTLSPPKRVLTRGPVRTDAEGRFAFEPPDRSTSLHVWCPELRTSARHPWRPADADLPVTIRLGGRALVGRLVDESGAVPRWPGINLKVLLVPPPAPGEDPERSPTGGLPVSLDRESGNFVALITAPGDRDLTVSALGHTGAQLLRRVPMVNRQPLPVVVVIRDPRGAFGAISVHLEGVPADGPPAQLEAWTNGTAERLPLTGAPGPEPRTGPLAAGTYVIRAVAGNRLSAWRSVQVAAGAVQPAGVLTLRERGAIRVRALEADGSVARVVRVRLETELGVAVRADFRSDPPGWLAQDVFPGRYRVVVTAPPDTSVPWSGPAFVDVHEGGLHEVVFRGP